MYRQCRDLSDSCVSFDSCIQCVSIFVLERILKNFFHTRSLVTFYVYFLCNCAMRVCLKKKSQVVLIFLCPFLGYVTNHFLFPALYSLLQT